jgi:Na+/melibiose symporter-like transporter
VLLAPIALSLLPTFTLFHTKFDSIVQLYAISAVLYLVCAGLILSIRPSGFRQQDRSQREPAPDFATQTLGILHNINDEMRQGWRFIRKRPALLLAVIQLSFAGVLILVIGQIATPIVTNLLNLSPNLMAVVFAPAGVGLVIGSIFMPKFATKVGKLRTVFIGSLGLTFTTLLLPLVTLYFHWAEPKSWNADPKLLLAMGILMFIAGMSLDCINIPAQTAMQELTPEWIKGRVLALQLVLYNACSIPIILSIGALSDTLGIDRVLYIMAVCNLAFGIWGIYYERKHPSEEMTEMELASQPD